jgi:UDP-N-acetylmuramate dehydrogenase
MKDLIQATKAISPDTGTFTVTGAEHGFSYRHSRFSNTDDIILSATVRLEKGDMGDIKARMDEYAIRRRESQPLDIPSAGSVFKRPKDGYAATLIEQAGLKGFAIGGAQVSPVHSGFIVNRGAATFSDVMAVIGHVQEAVLKQFNIELELEVKVIQKKEVDRIWT